MRISILKRSHHLAVSALIASAVSIPSSAQSSPPASQLESLVKEARKNHPLVESAVFRAAAAKEVPSQRGSLPDPVLTTSLQNLRTDDFTLDGHPMTGVVVGLNQVLPFPGKLARREAAAVSVAAALDVQTESLRESTEVLVRRLYWQLHYDERAAAIVQESGEIVNMLTNVVHARFAVGQGAQQDATQAQVAYSELRSDLLVRKQAIVSTRRLLNRAVGRDPGSPVPQTASLPPRRALQSLRSLRALAHANNPRLAVSQAEISVAKSALLSAERERLPDFIVGAGYRARVEAPGDLSAGADMLSVTLGVTLPLWMNSKQGARVREQSERVSERVSSLRGLRLEVDASVGRSADVIARQDLQIVLYEKELLPEARLSVDASIGDYQVGKVGFVSVLQNWRTELRIKLEYEKIRAQRAQSAADLKWLVGDEISRSVP